MMTTIARQLRDLLKLKAPAYRVARDAGVDPTILSKLLHGAVLTRENDPRIIAVGRVLGLKPSECFEPATDAAAAAKQPEPERPADCQKQSGATVR